MNIRGAIYVQQQTKNSVTLQSMMGTFGKVNLTFLDCTKYNEVNINFSDARKYVSYWKWNW